MFFAYCCSLCSCFPAEQQLHVLCKGRNVFHVPADGWHVHQRLQILFSKDCQEPPSAGSAGALQHSQGYRGVGLGLRGADVRGQRRCVPWAPTSAYLGSPHATLSSHWCIPGLSSHHPRLALTSVYLGSAHTTLSSHWCVPGLSPHHHHSHRCSMATHSPQKRSSAHLPRRTVLKETTVLKLCTVPTYSQYFSVCLVKYSRNYADNKHQ